MCARSKSSPEPLPACCLSSAKCRRACLSLASVYSIAAFISSVIRALSLVHMRTATCRL